MSGSVPPPLESGHLVPATWLTHAGLETSRIGFGGSRLHHLSDEATRQRLLAEAMDLGMRYIDVAPSYGHGLAERSIGRFLQGRCLEGLVISTKWGVLGAGWLDHLPDALLRPALIAETFRRRVLGNPPRPSFTPDLLRASVASSLRRLRTDHIHILWMHEPTPELIPDPEALITTLESLRRAGTIGAFGVAGYAPHVASTLAYLQVRGGLDPMRVARQTDEAQWYPADPPEDWPDVTFGALARMGQSRRGPRLDGATAINRLAAALARRPIGCVLVSSTWPGNMTALVAGLPDQFFGGVADHLNADPGAR